MRTRAEHIEALQLRGLVPPGSDLGSIVDYAIEHGMEFAPEQVEPKVGDELTEATRLVNDLAVVTLSDTVWQLNILLGWAAPDVAGRRTTEQVIDHGGRIVYVPGGES